MRCSSFLLILGLVLTSLHSASANDLRIYFGSRRQQTFSSISSVQEVYRTYVVIDHTTQQFVLITYYKNRLHNEQTIPIQVDNTVPNSPSLTAASRAFIYSSSSTSGIPVNIYRFRSPTRPVILPISSSSAQLTARSFSYAAWFYAFAVYNTEETGVFAYQKSLTVQANDANKDLTGAVNLVLDDLRRRRLID